MKIENKIKVLMGSPSNVFFFQLVFNTYAWTTLGNGPTIGLQKLAILAKKKKKNNHPPLQTCFIMIKKNWIFVFCTRNYCLTKYVWSYFKNLVFWKANTTDHPLKWYARTICSNLHAISFDRVNLENMIFFLNFSKFSYS